jgi:hypothetical protein
MDLVTDHQEDEQERPSNHAVRSPTVMSRNPRSPSTLYPHAV